MQNSAPISPPPQVPIRHFSRPPRELAFAFALSLTLHLLAWNATPFLILAWREPATVSFDAVIVPHAMGPLTDSQASSGSANRSRRSTGPRSMRQKVARAPAAGFVAPPDAIALDPEQGAFGEVVHIAKESASDKGVVAENILGVTPATSLAEAILPAAPVAIEPEPVISPAPELPARISIAYNLSSNISDGVAEYQWTRDGNRFEIDSSMQATGFIVGNFVGVLHQVSQGEITERGLRPVSFRIRRGEGSAETADFLYASNELKLTRRGEARLLPLPPGIQDMQSFLFQLSFDAPRLRGGDDRLEVLVTNARKVYRHRFAQVGVELVQVRSGTVEAMHLRSEALDPEDAYEVWLAPANYYLPVKIKFYAGRFPVELIATSIRTTP